LIDDENESNKYIRREAEKNNHVDRRKETRNVLRLQLTTGSPVSAGQRGTLRDGAFGCEHDVPQYLYINESISFFLKQNPVDNRLFFSTTKFTLNNINTIDFKTIIISFQFINTF
jgi:hypothetical protein